MTVHLITEPAIWPEGPVGIGGVNVDQVGSSLVCIAPGYTSFQWYRDGVQISGATESVYVIADADAGSNLYCRAGRDSAPVSVTVVIPPTETLENIAPPSILQDNVAPGAILTGDKGTWVGGSPITYTYRWLRCDSTGRNAVAISGATSLTYTVISADLGSTLRLEVTASDSDELITVTSTRTGLVSSLMAGAVIAASRGNAFGQSTGLLSSGTEVSRTYGQSHVVGFAASKIRLMYGNYGWGINDSGHTPNTITALKASVRIASTTYPVFFSGSRTVPIAPGGFVISDAIDVSVNPGTTIFTYSCPTVGSVGQKWCIDLHARNIAGEGSTAGDVVDSGTVALASGAATFSPVAVLADHPVMPRPVVASVGTSIDHGVGDTGASQDEGFITRALEAVGIGVFRQGYRSQALYQLVANMSILSQTWAGCTHALLGDLINDVAAGRTLSQMQASLTSILDAMHNLKVKVVVRTTTPDTNTTDGYATVGGQTTRLSGEADRVTMNEWVRGLQPGGANAHAAVIAVFDAADAVESSRNSGKWKAPGYTADGVHPTTTGHVALAAALDPALFTAT